MMLDGASIGRESTAAGCRDTARGDTRRYRMMRLSRRFEETVHDQFGDGNVPGPLHLSIGQEAVAVGGCSAAAHDRRGRSPRTAATTTASPRAPHPTG